MADATTLARALAHGGRLEILAHLNSRIWELVGGGPLGHTHVTQHASRYAAELNPQPLPPIAAGQEMGLLLARGIIIVGGRDVGDAQSAFLSEIEDWCGTGWPRRWPFPWPDPREDLRDELRTELLLGGALGLAGLAAHYPAGEMRDLVDKASSMLLDAGLG